MKFSILLKDIIFEEESIFSSIKNDIENINNEFQKFDLNDVPEDFMQLWKHYLKLMNSNVDKKEIDKLIENIKELKGSFLSNWVLPHQKLEKIINYKNILLTNLLNKISILKDNYIQKDYYSLLPDQRSSYVSNLYEEKDNYSIINKINELVKMIENFNDNSLIDQFLNSWKNNLFFIKEKLEKEDLSESDLNEIKKISNEIIDSLILNWSIPHEKLQKLLNMLTYKNSIIKKINYYSQNKENPSIIEEINDIIDSLSKLNKHKTVKQFINFWEKSKNDIKEKINKKEINGEDIRDIQNILKDITNSLCFYFVIPHKQLQDLLNILSLQDKYLYVFTKN